MENPSVLDSGTMHALNADTRKNIIKYLSKRPYTASELSRALDKHVTTIAEHLTVLEKSGVVRKKESTNKWVYYTLTTKGENFLRPAYSWMLALSISLVAFIGGLYQITVVRFQATVYDVGTMATAERALTVTETTQTFDTNLVVGISAIIVGAILLYYAMLARKKMMKERAHMAKALEIY